jgi:hypothetical protein
VRVCDGFGRSFGFEVGFDAGAGCVWESAAGKGAGGEHREGFGGMNWVMEGQKFQESKADMSSL